MNNKLKKFLLINFCLFSVILIIAEVSAYLSYRAKYLPLVIQHSKSWENPEEYIRKNKPRYMFSRKFNYDNIRNTFPQLVYSSEKNEKRPIVTIGCSYTYGAFLEPQQTFAYKLHELTGRTTYNRGYSASGPQLVYRQLSDENFKNEVSDAEYVIYTFIWHHLYRAVRDIVMPYGPDIELRYVIKNGNLVEKKRPLFFLNSSFLVKTYLEYKNNKDYQNELNNGLPTFMKILEASVNQTKMMYPNSKFVFIDFPQSILCSSGYVKGSCELSPEQIKNIEKLGIIYIKASDLVGHDFCESKYRVTDGDHPSELAWDELVPKLAEKLNL